MVTTPSQTATAPAPSRTAAATRSPVLRLAERQSGVPARFIVPILAAAASLIVAVIGMYWDIGYHVDHGRDEGVLTVPHLLIVGGLNGLVAAAVLHGLMRGPRARGERSVLGLSLAPGAVLVLLCGSIALLGFPLDAGWHALFGEDVTLWGPTHLFMIGGASFATLGLWMLLRHGSELGDPTRRARLGQYRNAGGLLIGLSTFQAEFDFGVPQFQLLYQPVLIAFAAGLGLVCARSLLGRGGAVKVLGIFFVVRGALAIVVGPVAGFTTPHFPLYVVEALAVEAAALAAPRSRARFAVLAGAGVGTLGLAAEWAWSHVWMPHPWTASLLPEAAILSLLAAIGGAVLGARVAQALADPGSEPAPRLRPLAVGLAGAAVLVALAVPLPRSGGDGTTLAIAPTPAGPGQVDVRVTVDPPSSARGAEWFEVLSWQGRSEPRRIARFREVGPGRFEADRPVPVGGNWKSLVRIARGSHLMALPVFLPREPLTGKPGAPAVARAGAMTSDTEQLQRESRGGPAWLTTLAYSLLAGIVAAWIAAACWSLRLLEAPPSTRRRHGRTRPPRTVAAT
jgi:hypothetical protein